MGAQCCRSRRFPRYLLRCTIGGGVETACDELQDALALAQARCCGWSLTDQLPSGPLGAFPGLRTCWIERTGEHVVRKRLRRVEASFACCQGHTRLLSHGMHVP